MGFFMAWTISWLGPVARQPAENQEVPAPSQETVLQITLSKKQNKSVIYFYFFGSCMIYNVLIKHL